MAHCTQSCTLGAILILVGCLSGCGDENQKQAKIEGTVPTDGLTTKQRREKGGMDAKAAGYPGPAGSSSTESNRRSK